jgi:hypothetical protein
MGAQPPQEHKIGELCTPDIVDLPMLTLAEIVRPFEIKTSPIHMVQHSPFTSKEDLNLHLQALIQLLLTVNSCIKVRLDLQADKSPVVVKGPFFPRVVNERYRIRGTNV